ncbi:MAG: hypothetical protein KF874_10110 [Rhizobiaceae bacterium]|nr:hypothetical protein [Rhizobiaceae bacterium]
MAAQATFGKATDYIDAEYETVLPDTKTGPSSAAELNFAPRSHIESLRRQSMAGQVGKRSPFGFWACALSLAALAFWISGGSAIFSGMSDVPHTSGSGHIRIAGWDSRIDSTGTNPTLLVDGQIVNDGPADATLPALEIAVFSPNGAITRYKLGTGEASIAQRGTFPFSGRLHLPKDGIETITVSFAQ